MRGALVARLNEVFSRAIPEDYIHKKQVSRELQDLKGEGALETLLEILNWVIEEIGKRQQITRS